MLFTSCDKYKTNTKQGRRICTMLLWIWKAFDRVPRKVVRWALTKLGVVEWPIHTVMALYTEACAVVKADSGLCEILT